MGTLARNERSSGTPRGVSGARDAKALRRRDTYIPIPTSGRTVPFHRSFIKLFYFLFLKGMDKGILKRAARMGRGFANGGLLINSQGINCPPVAASNLSEPRGSGFRGLSDMCWEMFKICAVQGVSPRRAFPASSENCVANFRMVFLWKQF